MIADLVLFILVVLGLIKACELLIDALVWGLQRIDNRAALDGSSHPGGDR